MCVRQIFAAVESVSCAERALLLTGEDSEDVNHVAVGYVERQSGTQELLAQQGYIEMVGVVTCYICSLEHGCHLLCDLNESRAVLDIFVVDAVHCRRLLGDMHSGFESQSVNYSRTYAVGFALLGAIGKNLVVREFDYSVLGNVDARCLQIKEDKRAG